MVRRPTPQPRRRAQPFTPTEHAKVIRGRQAVARFWTTWMVDRFGPDGAREFEKRLQQSAPAPRTAIAKTAEQLVGARVTTDVDEHGNHWLRIEGSDGAVCLRYTPALQRRKLPPHKVRHGEVSLLYGPQPDKILLIEQPSTRRVGRRATPGRRPMVRDADLRAAVARWPTLNSHALTEKILEETAGSGTRRPSRWTIRRITQRVQRLKEK
jgi:hypothetical protein